jgi:hypothetical protein
MPGLDRICAASKTDCLKESEEVGPIVILCYRGVAVWKSASFVPPLVDANLANQDNTMRPSTA